MHRSDVMTVGELKRRLEGFDDNDIVLVDFESNKKHINRMPVIMAFQLESRPHECCLEVWDEVVPDYWEEKDLEEEAAYERAIDEAIDQELEGHWGGLFPK